MLYGTRSLHTGSAGGRYATTDGSKSTPDTSDENCFTVSIPLPEIIGICDEYFAKTYCQTGTLLNINSCAWSDLRGGGGIIGITPNTVSTCTEWFYIYVREIYIHIFRSISIVLIILVLWQVWKQKKVWEGFIKCCQRTKPQSFAVILQLPPQYLQELLNTSPDLKTPLLEHVMAFTDNQVLLFFH